MAEEGLAVVQDYESWQNMKQIPAKRKAPGSDTEPFVNSKKKKLSGSLQTKNAVQALNEYKPGMSRSPCCVVSKEELLPGLDYVVLSQSGPSHAPHFQIGVTLQGTQFVGTGG